MLKLTSDGSEFTGEQKAKGKKSKAAAKQKRANEPANKKRKPTRTRKN